MNPTTHQEAYARRISRVLSYVCTHIEDELSVELLSEVAGFSKFHFHRQFSAITGFTVAQFVRMTRLKRASYQLVFDPQRRIIEIAADAGFAAPESFARAFKEAHGQSPTEFRRAPLWGARPQHSQLPSPTQSNSMTPNIVQFAATPIAVLEHHGPQQSLMSTVGKFIAWRKSSEDSPVATRRTFGVPFSDADACKPEDFRFDVCGELAGPLTPNDHGVVEKLIPAGRCAVVRHMGSTDAIADTVREMYAQWLPQSGERLRDFPCFFHYIERMPKVKEHEQVTDIYLPLA